MVTLENVPLQTIKPIVDPVKYKEVYQYRHAPPRPLGLEKLQDLEVHSDVDFLADNQVSSAYVVSHTLSHSNQPVPRKLFHVEDLEDASGTDCSSIESDVCNQSLASSQLPTVKNWEKPRGTHNMAVSTQLYYSNALWVVTQYVL